MQQGRFTGIIKTQEKELGVLVEEAQRSQDVPNCDGKIVISKHSAGK